MSIASKIRSSWWVINVNSLFRHSGFEYGYLKIIQSSLFWAKSEGNLGLLSFDYFLIQYY